MSSARKNRPASYSSRELTDEYVVSAAVVVGRCGILVAARDFGRQMLRCQHERRWSEVCLVVF